MAQPLLATFRIEIAYSVAGFLHKWRGYCEVDDPGIAVPVLVGRNGDLTDWDDCADFAWQVMINIADSSADGATAVLQQLISGLWQPIAAASLVGTGAGASYTPASQFTLVVRDTAFKKIRVVLMEPGLGLYVGHSNTGRGITGDIDDFVDGWDGTDVDLAAPYNWQKSRGDRYILGSGMVAGGTLDLNDKLKRSRGLE